MQVEKVRLVSEVMAQTNKLTILTPNVPINAIIRLKVSEAQGFEVCLGMGGRMTDVQENP